MRTEWELRAAWCARQVLADEDGLGRAGLTPERSPGGDTSAHLKWIAVELAEGRVEGDAECCRWLGYLQAGLVLLDWSTLEAEERRRLASRVAAVGHVEPDARGSRLYWVGHDPTPDGEGQFLPSGTPSGHPHRVEMHLGRAGPVGEVRWYCWPQSGDYRWRFHWSCSLPGGTAHVCSARDDRTYDEARAELKAVVMAWLAAAAEELGETV